MNANERKKQCASQLRQWKKDYLELYKMQTQLSPQDMQECQTEITIAIEAIEKKFFDVIQDAKDFFQLNIFIDTHKIHFV